MTFDSEILNYLWGLIAIPLAYVYKQNTRITKLETIESHNSKTLESMDKRLCKIETNTAEINGLLKEHFRNDE